MATAMVALATPSSASAAVPTNDDFAAATRIGAIPFGDGANTTDAGTAGDDPWCGGGGHTVWYSFTPSSDIDVAVYTAGSDYDTALSVYTGSRGSLTQVACNDYFGGPQAAVAFHALSGTRYRLMVGSTYGSPGGNLHLTVEVAPAEPDVTVALDGRSTVNQDGTATIRGTAICNQPLNVYMYASVEQKSARKIRNRGGAYGSVECGASGAALELEASSYLAPFFPGTMKVTGDAYFCSIWGCSSAQFAQDVKLRRQH